MSFVNDTFTDANSTALTAHTPDTGGAWLAHPSSLGTPAAAIGGNRLGGTWGLYGAYYNNATPPSADYSVSVDVQNGGTLDNAVGAGCMIRLSSLASLTCYMARIRSGSIVLEKYVSNSLTSLGSVSYTLTNNEDFRLTLKGLGTAITVKVQRLSNGNYINSSGIEQAGETDLISATDSGVTSADFVGITGRLAVWTFDNFSTKVPTEYTESVSQSLGVSQANSVIPYRVPLHIFEGRIRRLPSGERILGQDPDSFLVQALSDTASATYYYYGGIDQNGDWKIVRYLQSDLNSRSAATISNNGSYATLSAAWTDRASLSYV